MYVRNNQRQIIEIRQSLIGTVANSLHYQRSGKNEPRCAKRRPKPCQLMTVPRGQMKEPPHRCKKMLRRLNLAAFRSDDVFNQRG